jgi:HemY protein
MIRLALVLTILATLVVVLLAMVGEPGAATLTWMGWRIDMTAVSALMLVLIGALFWTLFWRLVFWIAEAPQRNRRKAAEQRRRQGAEALSKGFIAVATGDGSEARRLAQRAADLVEDSPALVRVLAAQAAEAAGDTAAAQAAYTAMLGFPEMRQAGLKGLTQLALHNNDRPAALRHAQEAYAVAKTSRWAWRALLEDRLEAGDWSQALQLVKSALDRKIVSPIVAERARAALLAASAASLETSKDAKARAQALDFAARSAKLAPDFTPGVVIAARLYAADGKTPRAASLLEAGWKLNPHPALWLAYRDLSSTETPKERAARLESLARLNPDNRESRMLMVEQALLAGMPTLLRATLEGLAEEPLTARLCGLRSRAALALGDADEARAWIARAAAAPTEPEWSDIASDGRAFAYTPTDWAKLVSTYAETGELIHPRFERKEKTISDLPDLPVAYQAAHPLVQAAETGLPMIPLDDEPDPFDPDYDDEPEDFTALPRSAERRRPSPRRRLATGPRASK